MSEIRMSKIIIDLDIDNEHLLLHDSNIPTKTETEQFLKKFQMLEEKELEYAFRIRNFEFFEVLNQMVPCVGCRRSSEIFYQQLIECECGKPPFYPICVDKHGTMTLAKDRMKKTFLCALFYCPSVKMQNMFESLRKCKPGKRCTLHSIDSQRLRCANACSDVWDYINGKFQDNSVFIEAKTLVETIDQYSHRHRFCTDCKSKIMVAYNLLVGEADSRKEHGFIPQLYDGIKFVKEDRYLHVSCKADYFDRLIANAATGDLLGTFHQERHAKTMEMAQQEVLTCLGICIYERLHRLQNRCREQQRTCEIIMCVAIQAFRRSFERAVEKKLGVSQLELLCEELSKNDIAERHRKDLKKLKKQKKKEKKLEVADQEDEEKALKSEACSIAPISTPIKTVTKDELEESNYNAFEFIPVRSKKDKNKKASCDKNKAKHKEKSHNMKNPGSLNASSTLFSKQSSNCSSTKISKGITDGLDFRKAVKKPGNSSQTASDAEKIRCLDAQREQNFGKVSKSKWQVNGSGDIENRSVEMERRELPCRSYDTLDEDLKMSSSSDESDVDEYDFLPDVDKTMILTQIWRDERARQREKLLRDFNKFIAESNAAGKAVEYKCDGDKTGVAAAILTHNNGNVKENSFEKSGRAVRKGGQNKSRQTQSTKKYKGKNRR